MSTILDMDSLLDSTLDNVEDVPDYVQPPAGNYQLKCVECKIEQNKSKKKGEENTTVTKIRLTHEITEVKELADAKEVPPATGSLFSETFMANEDGLKYFKKQAKAVMNVEDLNGVSLRDVISSCIGNEYSARITVRKTPGEGGVVYENAQVRIIPPTEG